MGWEVDFQYKGWNFSIIPAAVIRWKSDSPDKGTLCSGFSEDRIEELFWLFAEQRINQILDERRKQVAEKWLVRHFNGTFTRDDVREIFESAYRKMNSLIEEQARQAENLNKIPGRKLEA